MIFHFVDSRGTSWMVISGLPSDHPATTVGINAEIIARRVGPRMAEAKTIDWEALLRQAEPWPPPL